MTSAARPWSTSSSAGRRKRRRDDVQTSSPVTSQCRRRRRCSCVMTGSADTDAGRRVIVDSGVVAGGKAVEGAVAPLPKFWAVGK